VAGLVDLQRSEAVCVSCELAWVPPTSAAAVSTDGQPSPMILACGSNLHGQLDPDAEPHVLSWMRVEGVDHIVGASWSQLVGRAFATI